LTDVDAVFDRARRHSNWGRWGTDDERGALNLVGPEQIVRATGLVRRGVVFSLSLPFERRGPQSGLLRRTNPIHLMLRHGGDVVFDREAGRRVSYTDDAIYMPLQCSTQWDAFSHVFVDGQMYNGVDARAVDCDGAAHNSIDALHRSMVGRGVLLDIARHRGLDALPGGYAISAAELEGCARDEGVEVGQGDFVLVRTGHLKAAREAGTLSTVATDPSPGLAVDAADYFCACEVAAVATDTYSTEVMPPKVPGLGEPMHVILLAHAGVVLGELFTLEELAADCADDRVFEFLLAAPPLRIVGGVASPVNPMAIK
jgi:kynurenine formamidase